MKIMMARMKDLIRALIWMLMMKGTFSFLIHAGNLSLFWFFSLRHVNLCVHTGSRYLAEWRPNSLNLKQKTWYLLLLFKNFFYSKKMFFKMQGFSNALIICFSMSEISTPTLFWCHILGQCFPNFFWNSSSRYYVSNHYFLILVPGGTFAYVGLVSNSLKENVSGDRDCPWWICSIMTLPGSIAWHSNLMTSEGLLKSPINFEGIYTM